MLERRHRKQPPPAPGAGLREPLVAGPDHLATQRLVLHLQAVGDARETDDVLLVDALLVEPLEARRGVGDLELILALELLASLALSRLLLVVEREESRRRQRIDRGPRSLRHAAQQVADDGVDGEQPRIERRQLLREIGIGLEPVLAGLEVRVDVDDHVGLLLRCETDSSIPRLPSRYSPVGRISGWA